MALTLSSTFTFRGLILRFCSYRWTWKASSFTKRSIKKQLCSKSKTAKLVLVQQELLSFMPDFSNIAIYCNESKSSIFRMSDSSVAAFWSLHWSIGSDTKCFFSKPGSILQLYNSSYSTNFSSQPATFFFTRNQLGKIS